MKRTLVIGLAVLTLLAGLDRSSPHARAGDDADTRPNILVIVTDDQRAKGTVGVMPTVREEFVEEGLAFKNAYASSPYCCPSRASIMTGRYPHNHGVTNNRLSEALGQESTIQRYLHDAGYLTGLFGKYFNDWNRDDPPPYFESYAFKPGENVRSNYYDGVWNVQGEIQQVFDYSTDFIARKTGDFIADAELDDDRPWFAWVAPFAPHRPFIPESAYVGAPVPPWGLNPAVREKDRSDKPNFVQGSTAEPRYLRFKRGRQLRTLMSVDDLVARVLDQLRRLGEENNTLVFFTSDNGLMWGEHGVRGKGFPYSPSVKVPLALRWHGHVLPGARRDVVSLVDITPTIFDVTGLEPDPAYPLDGKSLFAQWSRERLLLEFSAGGGYPPKWASTRTTQYQYIEYYSETGEVIFREYYDLEEDPAQLKNLLGDDTTGNDPDVEYLEAQLEADRECAGDTCP